jgi:hypothetical protein
MTLQPIPDHLPAWQAPHLAWLASQGHPTRYTVPEDTVPVRANLHGADLSGANLHGAYLHGAYLHGANLHGATGIATIGPVGRSRRLVYAVAHADGPRIQAGCWWGSVEDTIARIEVDYADDPTARDRYVAAVRVVAALVTP